MKKGKIVFLVFASLWAVLLIISAFTAKNYSLGARIIVILMAILPLGIYYIIKLIIQKNQNKYNNRSIDSARNINSFSISSSNIKNSQNYKGNDISNTPTEIEKQENESTTYIHQGNTIVRSDGKPISNEDIPNLINIGYQQSIEYEKQSANIKFHRTEKEEDMSLRFMMSEHKELDNIINEFEYFYRQSAETNSIEEKIKLLYKAVASFEKAKKFAYKTKGGMIYFQDMYEHMHNSRNEDFSYLELIEDELEALIYDRDYTIPTLKKIISEHNGIIQKDVYQYASDIPKSEVQRYIKMFEEEGIIKRTKKGTSYILEVL